jgi:hypothetical protein
MARRGDRWVLGIATVLLALTALVVWGFVRVPGEPWRTFPESAARADTGVELRVTLRRDTISSRDRSPVEVLYWIVNGPATTTFDNDPENWAFLVIDEQGQIVQPPFWSHRPTALWGDVRMTLPAGAVLGQVENLRCVRYAAYGTMEGTKFPDCMVMWDFARPGTYRVIVKYRGPDDWGDGDRLQGDTGIVDMDQEPIREGRRLADTAILVVR